MNGYDLWTPIAITVFAWWFSTGLILFMVRLARRLHNYLLAGFAVLAGVGVWGLLDSANNQTSAGAYCGFVCSLLIWGWHEASFLMGKITGPSPIACPYGVTGWKRFPFATATLIYHEIALFITLIAIVSTTWQAPNQIGAMTFGLLFVMRLSAKFNIFLGVPNLTDEFFPTHLEHLKSYLPKRPMNGLMPFSLVVSVGFVVYLLQIRAALVPASGAGTGVTIILTLAALGILEHLFMITPLPDAALWRWAAPARSPNKRDTSEPHTHNSNDPAKHDHV